MIPFQKVSRSPNKKNRLDQRERPFSLPAAVPLAQVGSGAEFLDLREAKLGPNGEQLGEVNIEVD